MNTALWIAQGLLAVAYGMAGFMKATSPIPQLAERMGWPGELPRLTRFIGVAELAAAIAMILPILFAFLQWLTPLAAAGLTLIQLLAIGFHIQRNEYRVIPVNIVLLALSAFVLIGRIDLF